MFNWVGDKGYIKNNNYVNYIKDNNNITLITPLRSNSKKENINEDNKILLKDRSKLILEIIINLWFIIILTFF